MFVVRVNESMPTEHMDKLTEVTILSSLMCYSYHFGTKSRYDVTYVLSGRRLHRCNYCVNLEDYFDFKAPFCNMFHLVIFTNTCMVTYSI